MERYWAKLGLGNEVSDFYTIQIGSENLILAVPIKFYFFDEKVLDGRFIIARH